MKQFTFILSILGLAIVLHRFALEIWPKFSISDKIDDLLFAIGLMMIGIAVLISRRNGNFDIEKQD